MKKTVTLLIVVMVSLGTLVASKVSADIYDYKKNIGYNNFPPDLQRLLDRRIADLKKGGICIAGKVTMSDGAHIKNGEGLVVNWIERCDKPLWIYEDGWFLPNPLRSGPMRASPGPGQRFAVRAFGYDPIDAKVTIMEGKVTYLKFELKKTSPKNMATVTGTVVDENDQLFKKARVSIHFPFACCGNYRSPRMETYTDSKGQYAFEGLSSTRYSISADKSGYASHYGPCIPPVSGVVVHNIKLYPLRKIVIDYVYQADGSRSFVTGNLQKGTISWLVGRYGYTEMDFSSGEVGGNNHPRFRDLALRQYQDILKFLHNYVAGQNGSYDAGAVDFESVTQVAKSGYSTSKKLCLVGHVYVG